MFYIPQFAQSTKLVEVTIIGHPGEIPELLHALSPVRRFDGTYGPLPASQLRTLSLKLPDYVMYTAEAADKLVDMIFGIMAYRGALSKPLEKLIITECLTKRPSFESAYLNTQNASLVLETSPCECDEHDVRL